MERALDLSGAEINSIRNARFVAPPGVHADADVADPVDAPQAKIAAVQTVRDSASRPRRHLGVPHDHVAPEYVRRLRCAAATSCWFSVPNAGQRQRAVAGPWKFSACRTARPRSASAPQGRPAEYGQRGGQGSLPGRACLSSAPAVPAASTSTTYWSTCRSRRGRPCSAVWTCRTLEKPSGSASPVPPRRRPLEGRGPPDGARRRSPRVPRRRDADARPGVEHQLCLQLHASRFVAPRFRLRCATWHTRRRLTSPVRAVARSSLTVAAVAALTAPGRRTPRPCARSRPRSRAPSAVAVAVRTA